MASADGEDVVSIAGGAGLRISIEYGTLICVAGDSESAKVTITLKVPAMVGSPEMLADETLRPGGKEEFGAAAQFQV